ncbi:GGDEF domain-containing protein [Ferrimonas sediminicola]|uniref:diguanylate cyclase n=1 Tax=Ferrimonas sediminicola TaxID=2569538 RepID=A0A4U1BGA1_9GAMM|nr:GGDEF domain-containing protein [Ferrimonas sediminicola]TKB50342.1 GGDEF domain-containing protein [Ferrimonas sediminicola]
MDLVHTDTARRRVFQGLCLALMLATFSTALVNLYISSHPVLAAVEFAFSASSFLLFQYSRTHRELGPGPFIYLTCCVLLTVVAMLSKPVSEAIFAWFLFFPLVHYVILGQRQGAVATALTLTAALITLVGHPSNTLPLSLVIINLTLTYLCIWILAHVYEANRERSAEMLSQMALRDALTGCYNRHALSRCFQLRRTQLVDQGRPFAMLVADLDHFKQINDRYGHDAGDEMLRQSGELMRRVCRDTGQVFRTGGEEFCILLNCDTEEHALAEAERLRQGFEHHGFLHQGQLIRLSISIGVTLVVKDEELQKLLNRADSHLYQAKHLGRNRVMLAS